MNSEKDVNKPLHVLIRNANQSYTFYTECGVFPHIDPAISPYGIGLEATILKLGEYPPNTKFNVVDQFDGLTIFNVEETDECFSLWNEDLIECFKRGYIYADGGLIISEPEDKELNARGSFNIHFLNHYMKTTDYFLYAAKTCHKTRGIFFCTNRRKYWTDQILVPILDGHYYEVVFKTKVMLESLIKELAKSHYKFNLGDQKIKDRIKEILYRKSYEFDEVAKQMFGNKLIDYSLGENGILYPNNLDWDRKYKRFYTDVRNYFKEIRNVYCHNITYESQDIIIQHLKKAIGYYEEIEKLAKASKISSKPNKFNLN